MPCTLVKEWTQQNQTLPYLSANARSKFFRVWYLSILQHGNLHGTFVFTAATHSHYVPAEMCWKNRAMYPIMDSIWHILWHVPVSMIHGAHMGPTWGPRWATWTLLPRELRRCCIAFCARADSNLIQKYHLQTYALIQQKFHTGRIPISIFMFPRCRTDEYTRFRCLQSDIIVLSLSLSSYSPGDYIYIYKYSAMGHRSSISTHENMFIKCILVVYNSQRPVVINDLLCVSS